MANTTRKDKVEVEVKVEAEEKVGLTQDGCKKREVGSRSERLKVKGEGSSGLADDYYKQREGRGRGQGLGGGEGGGEGRVNSSWLQGTRGWKLESLEVWKGGVESIQKSVSL